MLDENLAKHCKNVHNKPKRVKGQQTLSFAEPVPKKNKLVHMNKYKTQENWRKNNQTTF